MRLKSTDNFSLVFLTVLGLVVGALWYFSSINSDKDKYPAPPIVEQQTPLDLIQITVEEKAFEKLNKKRNKALSVGILETNDNDYVKATITFNGKDFPAEIRLKGDWTDHLEGEKWSFRVKLKNDQTIKGMRKFSLHHPRTRRFLNEWLYHNAMKREGLMGLRYNFVEGKIHVKLGANQFENRDVGIYAMEETFDKRTIESNQRKESIILKFSEDYWWNEVKKSNAIAKEYGYNTLDFLNAPLIGNAKHRITVFSESKVLEDTTMNKYFNLSKNLLEDLRSGRTALSKVFDIKKLAMDTALNNLFGAVHATNQINVRYYYNPITSKLEPISFDGFSGVKLQKFKYFIFSGREKDPIYLRELAIAIDKVSQPQYLIDLIDEHKDMIDHYDEILKTEFKQKLLNDENLRSNQNVMRQELLWLKARIDLSDLQLSSLAKIDIGKRDLSAMNLWDTRATTLTSTDERYQDEEVYSINRINGASAGFVSCSNVEVNFGEEVEISIKVKPSSGDEVFGFRIQDVYPSRVDAIFDLKTGKLKDLFKDGSFANESASIKRLSNGWFECTIKVQANTPKLNIIFGPSSSQKSAFNWEGPTGSELSEILIVPKSLNIKEQ